MNNKLDYIAIDFKTANYYQRCAGQTIFSGDAARLSNLRLTNGALVPLMSC